jgi:drug/metabolite transporter, DME family
MAHYFSFLAVLFFSVAHILIRRGLVHSNAMTGSFISLTISAVVLLLLVPFFVPYGSLWNPAIGYFVAAGIFAPGIGRTLGYVGIERIGVARSVPIVNSSPIFASIFAVLYLGESWGLQNIAGTCLVILGVVMLSMTKPVDKPWHKMDIIYPILGAIAFGASANLRKAGLDVTNIPILAAATTASTAALFSFALLQFRGGKQVFKLPRHSAGWLIPAGIINTAAMLSVFYALSFGKVVIVEPLVSSNPVLTLLLTAVFLRDLEALSRRVIIGALLAVAGTILVVTVK